MNALYVLIGIVSVGWFFASYDDGMATCVERHSFTTCQHALNR